jgi:hypothetical protein
MSYSTISISNVIGLKKVFVIIISWSGCPINGVELGLLVGDEDGDKVKNIKLDVPSTYRYLIAF